MKALLGAKYGPQRECCAECIKCHKQIVFLLPNKPIRGQLAQIVMKYECSSCGQVLYATTRINGQAVLATRCFIANDQMGIENPVVLEIEDMGDFRFSGNRLPVKEMFVVGKGKDGKMALLKPEDIEDRVDLVVFSPNMTPEELELNTPVVRQSLFQLDGKKESHPFVERPKMRKKWWAFWK